jgi:hypothetical protein
MKYGEAYRGALKLQRLIMAEAPEAGAKELAMIGKTYASLEILKLRLRMKPAPKPVDTTKLQQGRGRPAVQPSFTES